MKQPNLSEPDLEIQANQFVARNWAYGDDHILYLGYVSADGYAWYVSATNDPLVWTVRSSDGGKWQVRKTQTGLWRSNH